MTIDTAGAEVRRFLHHLDVPALVDLICEVNRHDDVDWLPTTESLEADWAPHPGFDPARDVVLVELAGRLVAAGWVDWRERDGKTVHNFEIFVHPEHRRRGFGRRVLAWLEDRARTSVADGSGGSQQLPHVMGGGLIVTNPAAVAFARQAGYRTIRYGFEMRRPLDLPIPEVPLPDGLEVRPVLPEHHRAIWDADLEAFRDHWEAGVRHEADFVRMFTHPDHDTALWQVAWAGDEVAGSVMNNIYRDENAKSGRDVGWLDHVSVRRPWRGRGLAGALIVRSLAILREQGMTLAALGVDAENPTGALGLYERFGFRPYLQWAVVRKDW